MMVSSVQLTVPSAAPIQISLSVNPNQLKTERLENNLRLCGENWLTNLKFSSLMEMTALDTLSHVLSMKVRRNGVWKPVFKLATLGSGQTLTLVAPELSVPGISPEVLQRVLSQANKVNVWWPPCRLLAFFAAWRVEAPFSAVLMIVGAHAMQNLVFSFLPYGFCATNPYWCRRLCLRRILTWLVPRCSWSKPPLACR